MSFKPKEFQDEKIETKSKSVPGLWNTVAGIGIIVAIIASIGISFLQDVDKFLIIGGIIGVFLGAIMFFRPALGAYLIIFTTFSNLSDLFTENGLPSINQPLVVALFLVVIANILFTPERLIPLNRISRVEWSLIAYTFVIIISYTYAANKDDALHVISNLVKNLIILFTVFITLNTRQKIRNAIWVMTITIGILSLLGVIQSVLNLDFTFWGLSQKSIFGQTLASGSLRYGGPIAESNVWGQVLVVSFPYFIYRVLGARNNSFREFLMIIATFLVLMAILLTGSRGGFIALLIIFPIIALEIRVKIPTVIVGLMIGALALVVLPRTFSERFLSLIQLEGDSTESIFSDEAVQGRLEKMRVGLAMFKDKPLTGVGIGNYNQNYWIYAEDIGIESNATNIQSVAEEKDPHSLYIEILSETGLIGFGTFAIFLLSLLKGSYEILKTSRERKTDIRWKNWVAPIFVSLIAYIVTGFFLHGVSFRWFWVVAAIAMSAIHLTEYQYQNT
jgi:O-antigen ligase